MDATTSQQQPNQFNETCVPKEAENLKDDCEIKFNESDFKGINLSFQLSEQPKQVECQEKTMPTLQQNKQDTTKIPQKSNEESSIPQFPQSNFGISSCQFPLLYSKHSEVEANQEQTTTFFTDKPYQENSTIALSYEVGQQDSRYKQIEDKQKLSVGTNKDCDIVIADGQMNSIALNHGYFSNVNKKCYYTDNFAKFGSYKLIDKIVLQPAMVFNIGLSQLMQVESIIYQDDKKSFNLTLDFSDPINDGTKQTTKYFTIADNSPLQLGRTFFKQEHIFSDKQCQSISGKQFTISMPNMYELSLENLSKFGTWLKFPPNNMISCENKSQIKIGFSFKIQVIM